jgi:hypothetical protein
MAYLEDEVNALSQLMDEEISIYHLLIEDLKRESECLRGGAIDSLVEVVKAIEQHTDALRRLHPSIQSSIERAFEALEKDEKEKTLSRLVSILPPVYQGKVKSNQKILLQLHERVKRTNQKNRTFIEEHLILLRHLTSFLINPVPDPPCYPQTGRRPPTVAAYALNREV